MKKSTVYLLSAAMWFCLGLAWFFGSDNNVLRILWLVTGILETVIFLFMYSGEKKKE